MSIFSYGYGDNLGNVDRMDQMGGPQDHNMLSASGDAGDHDLMMNELAADMLPFDLDLNALPDSGSQNQSPAHVLPSREAENDQSSERKDNSGEVIIGAGPLPTGFGVQLAPGQGSTLTEFTKRRNWSQRIIEELKDFLHVLSPDGRILYVSPSSKGLTGYESQDLVGKIISDFIHPDDSHVFIREFNESIASGNPLRFFYRFKNADGSFMILECHGHPHLAVETATYGSNNSAGLCRGFFMMARRYPTKNSALLDSFLEHKVENERLRKRIAELKREEQEDMEGQKQFWPVRLPLNPNGSSDPQLGFDSRTNSVDANSTPTPSDYDGMPPPAKPSVSNIALTQQNLDEVLASSRPDSIKDKMARYEGATHIETIEMLTGLRYRDGERSKGISTGDQSPTLIRGDAGIPIQVDKNGRPAQSGRAYSNSPYGEHGDKKKKLKVADEYVCTDCGTLDSPEWRKGPSGPKTLCNACGLRWAKKEKKRSGYRPDNGNGDESSTISPSHIGPSSSVLSAHGMVQQLPGDPLQQQMSPQNNPPGIPTLAPSTDHTTLHSARGPQ